MPPWPSALLRAALWSSPSAEADGTKGHDQALDAALLQECGAAHPRQQPLALAYVSLSGFEACSAEHGRLWSEEIFSAAAAVLTRLAEADRQLNIYRIGVQTFAVVLTRTLPRDAQRVAGAIATRIERDAAPLQCHVGLACLSQVRPGDHGSTVAALRHGAEWALEQGRGVSMTQLSPTLELGEIEHLSPPPGASEPVADQAMIRPRAPLDSLSQKETQDAEASRSSTASAAW